MEDREVWEAFISTACASCRSAKRPRNAFCLPCYRRLPAALKQSLYKRFGQGFEQAYHACLSWFRVNVVEVGVSDRERVAQLMVEIHLVSRALADGWVREMSDAEISRRIAMYARVKAQSETELSAVDPRCPTLFPTEQGIARKRLTAR